MSDNEIRFQYLVDNGIRSGKRDNGFWYAEIPNVDWVSAASLEECIDMLRAKAGLTPDVVLQHMKDIAKAEQELLAYHATTRK